MKNKILVLCLALFILTLPAFVMSEGLFGKMSEPKIFINNRILAKVNGKPISTYDVMKKMDLVFYKEYPEYVSMTDARFQFYQLNWKHELDELIIKELILADAKESKIEVSGGDLRQEMEKLFGPNIIANLDKVGMNYEEASNIVEGDLILKRMLAGRVNNKAMGQVTPSMVKAAYDVYIKDPKNIAQDTWSYRVITFKEPKIEKTEESSKIAYEMLKKGVVLADLIPKLKEQNIPSKKGKVTLSEVIQNSDKEIAQNYKDILVKLSKGTFSEPFSMKSRADKMTVFRILFLVEKINGEVPSYKDMEPKIKDHLLNEVFDKETDAYIEKLKHHFHVRDNDLQAMLPKDYEPFMMK
jgi:hypothetical protein